MPTNATRVLYIAGYGRSGSTVLELALARHEQVFAAGEVRNLFRDLGNGSACGCGAEVRACAFWGGVVEAVRTAFPATSPSTLDGVTRAHERGQPGSRRAPLYEAVWRTVFEQVAALSGATVVVDSSKTSWSGWARPYRLARVAGLDVRVAPLVRHPGAVAASRARGRNRDLAAGRRVTGPERARRLRGYAGWTFGTLVARRASRSLGGCRVVTYEAFLQRPGEVVAQLWREVGLELSEQPVGPGILLHAGHSLAGNRLKQGGPIHLGAPEQAAAVEGGWAARGLAAALWPGEST